MDKVKLKSKLHQLNKKANVILENMKRMDNQTKSLMLNELEDVQEELTSLSELLNYLQDKEEDNDG